MVADRVGDMLFKQWMAEANGHVVKMAGVSIYELPDCTFRDWFDDGLSPQEAADQALEEAGFNSFIDAADDDAAAIIGLDNLFGFLESGTGELGDW